MGVLLVAGTGAALAFLSRVLVQRALPANEVGLFALLMALVSVIGPLGTWGQATVTLRAYSRAMPGTYDYLADGLGTLAPGLLLVVALSAGASLAYSFGVWTLAFVVAGSLLLGGILWLTMLIRSHRRFIAATTLERLPHALLILVGVAVIALHWRLPGVLLGQILLLIATAAGAIAMVHLRIPRGAVRLTATQRSEGGPFLLHQLSFLASFYGDVLILGALLPAENLATYSVALNLMGAFDLLRTSLQTVLITESARRSSRSLRRIVAIAMAPVVATLAIYLALGIPVLHLVFSGRYDDGKPLVLILAVASFFQAVYSIPYSIITGRAESRVLRQFIKMDVVLSILSLGVLWIGTAGWGTLGTAGAVGATWLTRTLGGLAFLPRIAPPPSGEHSQFAKEDQPSLQAGGPAQ